MEEETYPPATRDPSPIVAKNGGKLWNYNISEKFPILEEKDDESHWGGKGGKISSSE